MNRVSAIRPSVGLVTVLVLLLVALAAAPMTAAKERGTDRPFWGSLGGQVVFLIDWTDPTCPVTTVTDATGPTSHLGAVTTHWAHCPSTGCRSRRGLGMPTSSA